MTTALKHNLTVFTDREAAVEELEFLAETTGHDHAIVDVDGKYQRFHVLPVHDLNGREALVTCKWEWTFTPAEVKP